MNETKTALEFRGRKVEMNDENTKAAMEVVGLVEDPKPVQMELPFERVYSDIQMKEAIRGVKAITKELIRLGADRKQIAPLMDDICEINPIIVSAIELMDEKLIED